MSDLSRHRLNRHTLGLGLYAIFVVLATLIHAPVALGVLALLVLMLAGGRAPIVLRRTAKAALPFTAVVAIPWLLMHGINDGGLYVLRLVLRVCAITMASFVLIERIDLLRAVRFSPTVAWTLTLITSQILVLQRAGADFSEAFESRCINRPSLRDRLRHVSAKAAYLVTVALRQCEEVALAMRSRGFFDAPREARRG